MIIQMRQAGRSQIPQIQLLNLEDPIQEKQHLMDITHFLMVITHLQYRMLMETEYVVVMGSVRMY